ncbi:MAG: hypothetical protein ABSG86_16535 [Thermoguttaceae bacterium]|jgi:hypothetical protein
MKIVGIESMPDFGKYIIHLKCGHTTILDQDVQEREGHPIGEIMEKNSLVCPICSLPAGHARGEK